MSKKMKRKRAQKPVTEERILQICNDESEGIASGTLREWKEAACYWRAHYYRLRSDFGVVRCDVAMLVAGQDIYKAASKGLKAWLDKQTPESTA